MYVYFGSGGVAGVSADDGTILWSTDAFHIAMATVPSPVILPGGRIFCAGGYAADSVMLQVKHVGGKFAAEVLWRTPPKVLGSAQTTPVYCDGRIYTVPDSGELVCADEGGKILWSSSGENFHLGPLMVAGGLVYVLDDMGTLTLARAGGSAYVKLASAKVLAGPDAWGPMAMAGGRLIVRDLKTMVCLDVAQH